MSIFTQHPRVVFFWGLCALGCAAAYAAATGNGHTVSAGRPDVEASSASNAKEVGNKVREALGVDTVPKKNLTVVVDSKGRTAGAAGGHTTRRNSKRTKHAANSNAHKGAAHWSYEGDTGPQAWARLKPEFSLCALGKRQSPINIESGNTLQGPAEPLQFFYTPSAATVVNNGHTIQVDVQGDNTLTVRGSSYRLVQFHFHAPSEEQVNSKSFAMVAHLVHRNAEGQLAVVAVLLEPGGDNGLIDKVWTFMPLDSADRVRMPYGVLNLNELLPADRRYYQFFGSLTTPPCTEGVLWLVLKQPVTLGAGQYRLFTQLYPHNARPAQALNGRVVREAQ